MLWPGRRAAPTRRRLRRASPRRPTARAPSIRPNINRTLNADQEPDPARRRYPQRPLARSLAKKTGSLDADLVLLVEQIDRGRTASEPGLGPDRDLDRPRDLG